MSIYTLHTKDKNYIDSIVFIPTRLYIKKHRLTGLRYFGKFCGDDILRYTGSGVYWQNHIEKYGRDLVITEWVSDWYLDPHLCHSVCIHFSRENDIVNSNLWANLIPETGLTGLGATSEESSKKRRETRADPDWISTTGKEMAEKISKTMKDPVWLEEIGYERLRKAKDSLARTRETEEYQLVTKPASIKKHKETKADPIWKETIGKEQSRKISEKMTDQRWLEETGYEARRKQTESRNKTKSDPEWKATVGKELYEKSGASCKVTKADPEWKATVGKAAAEKQSKIMQDPEWKATVGKERSAKISEKRKEQKEKRLATCKVCGFTGDVAGIARWHNSNCKKTYST